MRISAAIHDRVVHKLLRAPVDRFFDKQPVGRIMSRLVGDVCLATCDWHRPCARASVDLSLYAKTLLTITIIYGTVVPLIYASWRRNLDSVDSMQAVSEQVHTMVPAAITVMSRPRYWRDHLLSLENHGMPTEGPHVSGPCLSTI